MDRPPLLTRWIDLMYEDSVAQNGSLLAWFAITQGIFYHIPITSAGFWPYVAAVLSLLIGHLAFLDYRNWVRHKVQEEASRLDPNLSVSSMLLLSSPELQDAYYRWMDKAPAVAWYPCSVAFFFLFSDLKILSKNEDGCNCFVLVAGIPTIVLALVRVAMAFGGAPKRNQSIASLVVMAYQVTAITGMMALNDPCQVRLGPVWMSPVGNAVFVGSVTAVQIAMTPCTMQHLAALSVIVGPCHLPTFYMWSQRRHGGLGLISYPLHHVELIIIIAAAKTATLLVGAAVRYRLAQGNMIAFLRSVRPHRH